ncbi:protein FEZ [Sesamum alatum]|uniref:Protein FEZ n=1 Tax=Sesamum alatum TaxID=300844 RepID=A0AAE2CIT7_9LAMI|nr:protein FEZ [Sesamum alatum]
MEERNENDKTDEVMLPGFRFHPTDEELVGFYLRRKIQQKPLSIELIKQLDIYKYDPWDLPISTKKYLDKNIPANEAWAICRIFKKANSSTQRALSHSWISPVFDTTISADHMTMNPPPPTNIHFTPSSLTMSNKTNSLVFFNDIESSIASFSPIHFPPCKPAAYQMGNNKPSPMPSSDGVNLITTISSTEMTSRLPAAHQNCAINDASSLLLDMSSNSIFGELVKGSENVEFGTFHETCNGFSATVPENLRGNLCHGEEAAVLVKEQNVEHLDDQWGTIRSMGSYPYSYPLSLSEAWKSNLLWDSSSPCPSFEHIGDLEPEPLGCTLMDRAPCVAVAHMKEPRILITADRWPERLPGPDERYTLTTRRRCKRRQDQEELHLQPQFDAYKRAFVREIRD